MRLTMNLTKLLAPTLALLLPATAHADFYDGVRGPSKAQVHYTANVGETTTHNIAGKYFSDNVFTVGALSTDGTSLQGGFAGIGYLAEQLVQVKAIPVLGYGVSGDGKQGLLNTILQATAFLDKDGTFLADPRYILALPAHGQESHAPAHTFGLTLSAGNQRIRAGPDLSYKLGDPHISAAALVRYDIDAEKHSSWVEFGMGNSGAQIQFRGNF